MNEKILQIKCGTCGHIITSEHIHGSIIYCTSCHSYKVLYDNRSLLKPVFYKIVRFQPEERYYREMLLKFFCEHGHKKIFDCLEVIQPLRRYYIPVREIITEDGNHLYVSLNNERSELVEKLFSKDNRISVSMLSQAIREEITSDLTVNDYRPVYTLDRKDQIEILPIDVSNGKIDALYNVNSEQMLIVKYLPVFILDTNLCQILCIGSDENYSIANRDEVLKAINPEKKQSVLKKCWRSIQDWGVMLFGLGVLLSLGYGVYKFFTVGFDSVESFFGTLFKIIFTALGAVFMVLWACLWLSLYVLGFALIFGPVYMFLYCIFYRENSGNSPNEKKGRKIMNLA